MTPIKVHLDLDDDVQKWIQYIWDIFSSFIGFKTAYVQDDFDVKIGTRDSDVLISHLFIKNIRSSQYHYSHYFKNQPRIEFENGAIDYLGTSFYIINCLQEWYSDAQDEYGRFPFSASFQHTFDCVDQPMVNILFEELYQQLPILHGNFKLPKRTSQVVLTHDIDSLFQSKFQDTKYALKHGQFSQVWQVLRQELSGKPGFNNITDIVDLEKSYEAKSIFFWIPNKGRVSSKIVEARAVNSDYKIQSKSVQRLLSYVRESGSENGLHKSISNNNFNAEIEKLGVEVISNRNHYLRYRLPDHFEKLDASKIKVDYSMGFAEVPGFRNGFSLPFRPYNFSTGLPYDFLAVPMQIMDVTFNYYMMLSQEEMKQCILDFIDIHRYNAVLNILWHNTYFSEIKFAGFKIMYEDILRHLRYREIELMLSEDLLSRYYDTSAVRIQINKE